MFCEEEIPDGLNLKNTNFILSKKTLILAQQCLANIKLEAFDCNRISAESDYIRCLSCSYSDDCSIFSKLEEKIDVYEFFLDLKVETETKKRKSKSDKK